MKKIGILGGTFNPIHHGHLILGQAAKEEFGLDELLVMPTKNPAYKTISGGVSEKNRVDMIKLAIRDFPYFKFSDIELKREGTTYTVDTLRELTKQEADDYELTPAGLKKFWCVTTAFHDDGKVVSAITDVCKAAVKPENVCKETKTKDIYLDWFDTEEEAKERVEEVLNA